MRLANLDGRPVLVSANRAIDIDTASEGRFRPSLKDIYRRWDEFRHWAATAPVEDAVPFDAERLRAPVPTSGQLIAAGLNYRDHVEETGANVPTGLPPVFAKFPSSITGPYSTVTLPDGTVDWEAELAVVISRPTFRVSEADAWNHVAGLTVAQDLSERVLQMSGPAPQFGLAKSHPGFTPIGPWVVTLDEFDDAQNLTITCTVNDIVVQQASTCDLIFPVPTLISRLSAIITLNPGDVILTGTPGGVGMSRTPPQFLSPGDTVVTTIEGVGEIRQVMMAETSTPSREPICP